MLRVAQIKMEVFPGTARWCTQLGGSLHKTSSTCSSHNSFSVYQDTRVVIEDEKASADSQTHVKTPHSHLFESVHKFRKGKSTWDAAKILNDQKCVSGKVKSQFQTWTLEIGCTLGFGVPREFSFHVWKTQQEFLRRVHNNRKVSRVLERGVAQHAGGRTSKFHTWKHVFLFTAPAVALVTKKLLNLIGFPSWNLCRHLLHIWLHAFGLFLLIEFCFHFMLEASSTSPLVHYTEFLLGGLQEKLWTMSTETDRTLASSHTAHPDAFWRLSRYQSRFESSWIE